MLFFSRPKDVVRLNKTISVITSEEPDVLCILKFRYPGNTQYHKLSRGEAEDLVKSISGAMDTASR